MTRADAEDLLDEAGRLLSAAELHYQSVELDARSQRQRLSDAWKDWDLDTLVEMEILTPAQADDVESALATLED